MAGRILRADILRAATALLDSGGLSALAMRAIATRLEVQQSALYWHFRNKQELLAALADEILSPLRTPDGSDWAVRLTRLSTHLRGLLLDHQDGAELVATAYAFGLGATAPRRHYLDELARAGLSTDDADTCASVLLHFVLGYTTTEQQQRQAAALGAIDPVSLTDPGRMPGSADGFAGARFLDGLQVILAGIRPLATSEP